MATLILLKTPDGSATGERIQLNTQPLLIGRSPDQCKVVLPLNAVSREHAQIEFSHGKYLITDLKSRNGTFVNNKAIPPQKPTELKDGDGIKICDFLFCFRDEQSKPIAPIPLPPEFNAGNKVDLEEESNTTTVEATIGRPSSQGQFLDTQPSEKLRAIIKISGALSKTLEVKALLPQIVDELFEIFRQADRCFIIQVDELTGQLVPMVAKSRRSVGGSDRFSKTIVKKCLESLQSYLSEDASSDASIGLAQSIAEFRIRSVMCVPLATSDGKALGVIQLDSQDRTKKFTQEDLKLLICVANQASIALENARLHEEFLKRAKLDEENKAATKVQLALLPQALPIVPGYEFAAHYMPAQTVGGDYYDFVNLGTGKNRILLGDVSGKGVPAALIVARVSGEAKVSMLTQSSLSAAVTNLNDLFIQAGFEDRYLTLAATELDPVRNEVTLVNAGHFHPLVYRQSTRKLEQPIPDSVRGYPLGWVPGFEYASITIRMEPGDTLILYTDGVLDAESVTKVRFSEEGIRKAVENIDPGVILTPRLITQRIIDAVKAHMTGNPEQFDDIALVCYGRTTEAVSATGSSDSNELNLR